MVQSFPRGLAITAVAAKDLAKRKRFGAQDPYLAFYLQGRRKFTIVAVKGGVKPEWNQTIKYNRIQDGPSREETTLTVYCIHEKTGVKVGSGDGLIGSCEIDLKQTLFSSETGLHDGWFKLMYDGKESGQVHIRLQLCEPSEEEDKAEDAPLRLDHKNRIVKSKSEKRVEKTKDTPNLSSKASIGEGASSSSSTRTGALSGGQPSGIQRTPTGRLARPRSMADLEERKPTIKFQEPAQRRMGSRSLEEVREMATTPTVGSSDGDSYGTAEGDEDLRSVSSPKQTFTLQDSDGNINQLNWLTAPFDPNWLEPTPPILRRALSAQFYYDDLNTQMTTNPRELFPRPQSQQGHVGYTPEPVYVPNDQAQRSFQTFAQAQAANRPQRPNTMPININNHLPQQYMQQQPQQQQSQQQQSQQQQPQPQQHQQQQHQQQQPQHQQQQQQQLSPAGQPMMPTSMPSTQPQQMPNQALLPNPPQQPWGSLSSGSISYQPHTVFQPRQQPAPRSRMDFSGNSKYMSLPSRNQLPPQQMQMLRNAGEGGPNQHQHQQPISTLPGGMVTSMPQSSGHMHPGVIVSQPSIPPTSSLGPAAGYMPNTYSQEHQRALSNQLPQPAPPLNQPRQHLGPQPGNEAYGMAGSLPEIERPGTSSTFYSSQTLNAQPSAPLLVQPGNGQGDPGQPMYFASPIPQQQPFGPPQQRQEQQQQQQQHQHQHQQQQQQQQYQQHHQQPSTSYHQPGASFSAVESFSTMAKSPAIPIPAKIPVKAKDAIFSQYTPRAVTWEGKDIQESLSDPAVGRRILSRYALGLGREKYVREGFYTKDRSPLFADSPLKSQQHQQQEQGQGQRTAAQRQLQRQFTMDKEGNDRVILKYLKSKREWEIDSVMMRYLTCQYPEEKLESQYVDYAQPLQHCQNVNPFVVGLYETFMHPHGTDYDGCRYLSVLQWFPETLQGYIEDRIASGEGLEVTLPIIRSLVECAEWIHSRKICHLNIKPSNFVRDPYMASSLNRQGGQGWKLVDFEAARVIDEEIVGRCTFSYAAPEILIGNSSGTGVIAKGSLDIWSLGLVIYELLTDQPLFKTDDHAKDVLLPNAAPTINPIRFYDSKNIDPEYHPLLDAMLAHDPDKRLTASQLLQLDIFTNPIHPRPVSQDRLIRNNNILSLRDLKATRLCNLKGGGHQSEYEGRRSNSSNGSGDSAYGSSFMSSSQQQMMMLEGVGRVLDSPFDQVPRLFMLLPPMHQDLDPTQPFLPSNLFQNKSLRLVLLCEGLSGYGEDAHVTDHRGYVLQDPDAFVQDVGKLLLHLVAVAGTNNPGYETPALDRPLALTGTPLDNCQRWYPSLRSYYDILQAAILRQVGPAPGLNELRSLRGPTLKALEQWLARLVRRQCQVASAASERDICRKPSVVAQSDLISHAGLALGGHGYDDLSDQLRSAGLNDMDGDAEVDVDMPEVTGPGGGEGYGGLYKMPVGTCGDRWICRGCVSKQLAMAAGGTLGML